MEIDKETEKRLNSMKQMHDYYITAIMLLKERFQFRFEEFQMIHEMIAYFEHQVKTILAEIHKIEPPKEQEKKAPLVMDLTHVKPETKPHLEVVQ